MHGLVHKLCLGHDSFAWKGEYPLYKDSYQTLYEKTVDTGTAAMSVKLSKIYCRACQGFSCSVGLELVHQGCRVFLGLGVGIEVRLEIKMCK